MKKVLLIIILSLGLVPCLHYGRLGFFGVQTAYADDFGNEFGGDFGGTPDLNVSPSDISDGTMLHDVFIVAYRNAQSPNWLANIIFMQNFLQTYGSPQANLDGFDWNAFNVSLKDILGLTDPPPPPKKDPCVEAKNLTDALNKALAMADVLSKMNDLKDTKNSAKEHGIMITRDDNGGYHVSAVIEGTKNSVTFPPPDAGTTVEFIIHVHPSSESAAPSSTDILGLGGHSPDFQGNIIIYGDDMYMISITDQTAYDKFVQKSNAKGYKDVNSPSGWKENTAVDDEFKSFSRDYTELNKGVDATLPTQLHLMNDFNMGVTLQKWSSQNNKFQPQEVNTERNNDTGSSSSITGGGTPINSRYNKIEVNTKDCPGN